MDQSQQDDEPRPLASGKRGSCFKVGGVEASAEDTIRLKRLGICEGRTIQLVQVGDPLVVRVLGCRVGISRRLAACIRVTSAPARDQHLERPGPPASVDLQLRHSKDQSSR